jgi:hypothetical protein
MSDNRPLEMRLYASVLGSNDPDPEREDRAIQSAVGPYPLEVERLLVRSATAVEAEWAEHLAALHY